MRVAVIGTGQMGRSVIAHLAPCEIVSGIVAYDHVAEQARTAAQEFAHSRITVSNDFESILADRTTPLVFITASNAAHAPLAIAAMRAGKAVMCEKPMATSLADARELVNIAESTGAFLQIGFELRYSKLYATVKQWIDQGLLGDVINTHCLYICSEFHGRHSWRNQVDATGGMFAEKLSHYVDLPRWWIGADVTEVYTASSPNTATYKQVRDNYHATYRFNNGAVSHLTFQMGLAETFHGDPLQDTIALQRNDGHELTFQIIGTRGAAATDVFNRSLRRWEFNIEESGLISHMKDCITWTSDDDHRYHHNTTDQALDIVRRVRDGLPPMTPARDSLKTMELCFAAEKSADLARTVKLQEIE